MQEYAKIPFLLFFVAATLGLVLRWNFISPVSGLTFTYWLHAHSHSMFLGWVFNFLSLVFIHEHVDGCQRKKYLILFGIIQLLLLGMLISFPLQGYGLYSIIISSLHTVSVAVFSFWFFRDTRKSAFDLSRWFARISLLLFLLSSLGPFVLAPLAANGLTHTKWYYFAVYFYLHFQYNGVFTFGLLSLLFGLLASWGVSVQLLLAKRLAYLMLISCFLGYALSTLWAQTPLFFNIIGVLAALIQCAAFIVLLKTFRSIPASVTSKVTSVSKILFSVAFLSFTAKLLLQLLSAHPQMAQLAYNTRNYVMAYLHMVLLGMISTFLVAWSVEMKWIRTPSVSSVIIFLIGFVGTECLLMTPWPLNHALMNVPNLLFLCSVLLVLAIGMFTWKSFKRENQ
jgi:hypothetical protein